MTHFKKLAAAIGLAVLAPLAVQAGGASFDSQPVGQPPPGWQLGDSGRGKSKWTIERDETAPSKSNVLRQSGSGTYPVALAEGTAITNGFVETRFKAIAGSEDRAAGVVWRAKDAGTYYVVRANALEDNIVMYKTLNGDRITLDVAGRRGGYGVNAPVPPNVWHTLRVDFAGSRFKVTYNGRPLFEVEDKTLSGPGMVGLWTKEDSVTAFDDFAYDAAK